MRKTFLITSIFFAGVAGFIIACTGNTPKPEKTKPPINTDERVKRGEYLVNTSACDDCHSPKRMGPNGPEIIPELRLSGYPSKRPIQIADSNTVKQGWTLFGPDFTSAGGSWGMSFAANLTSDESGIGNWREDQFVKAIREGKWMGVDNTRPLLPPMPWFVYRNMTDEDLKSIFAYLKTTKPVDNVVPAPIEFKNLK